MKIVLSASMIFSQQMIEIKDKLTELGHEVVLPYHTEKYASGERSEETREQSVKNKIERDLIRGHFNEIKNADATLIVNYDKNGIQNYIGGNSFLEAGFGHVLNKKVYFLNSIPEMAYTDELKSLQPIILDGDLHNIS